MKEVRELCRLVAAEPTPTQDLEEFCSRLASRRRRPIHLLPFIGDGTAPTGVWVRGERQDYIFYDAATSPVHQQAIIWHELSHMLLGHQGPAANHDLTSMLLPDLDPSVVARMLSRHSYDHHTEREAEQLASLLMMDWHDLQQRAHIERHGSALRRLYRALNFRGEAT